jgi:hypothetical protein
MADNAGAAFAGKPEETCEVCTHVRNSCAAPAHWAVLLTRHTWSWRPPPSPHTQAVAERLEDEDAEHEQPGARRAGCPRSARKCMR